MQHLPRQGAQRYDTVRIHAQLNLAFSYPGFEEFRCSNQVNVQGRVAFVGKMDFSCATNLILTTCRVIFGDLPGVS